MYQNVMVIDDSYFDRLIAEKVIQIAHFSKNTITIDGALKAADYLILNADNPEKLPEIIFLDINMPEVSGFDFLDRFEEIPIQKKDCCKIFMLSSSVDPEDIKRAHKSKYVVSFISKPLTKEKLAGLILPEK